MQTHITSTGQTVATCGPTYAIAAMSAHPQAQRLHALRARCGLSARDPKEGHQLERAVARACAEHRQCVLLSRAFETWRRWVRGARHCHLQFTLAPTKLVL
jgi:hypothetical protein